MENNIFEEMAKRYDTEERKKLAAVVQEAVRPELENSKARSLIDYGSGTGLVSLALADLAESVLLVDSSKQMLEVAQAKIDSQQIANAKVLYADFTQGTPALKADIVLLSLVLLHIPDTKKILRELFGILNSGGKLLLVDFNQNPLVSHPKIHSGFLQEELKAMLSEAGFEAIDIQTFYHGKQIFAGQDASLFFCRSVKK